MAEACQLRDPDLLGEILPDVLRGVGQDRVLVGASPPHGGVVGVFDGVVGHGEILRDQLHGGDEHLRGDRGRREALAVKPDGLLLGEKLRLGAHVVNPVERQGIVPAEESDIDGSDNKVSVDDGSHVLAESGVAHAEKCAAVLSEPVVHLPDHGQAFVIDMTVGLDVHTKCVGVGEKGLERFVQLPVHRDKPRVILDTDGNIVFFLRKCEIVRDLLIMTIHGNPLPVRHKCGLDCRIIQK